MTEHNTTKAPTTPEIREVTAEPVGQLLEAAAREITETAAHMPFRVYEARSYGTDPAKLTPGSDYAPIYFIIGEGSPLRFPATATPIGIASGGPGSLIERGFLIQTARPGYRVRRWALDSKGAWWPLQKANDLAVGKPAKRPGRKMGKRTGRRKAGTR